MTRTFTCIICPNGCEITAEYEGTDVRSIEGATCPKGQDYVRQELTDPRRNIATSIPVECGELPLVSVRLDRPILYRHGRHQQAPCEGPYRHRAGGPARRVRPGCQRHHHQKRGRSVSDPFG